MARQRDYRVEYERRKALGEARGLPPKVYRGHSQFERSSRLAPGARKVREAAIAAAKDMRRGVPLEDALALHATTQRQVRDWVPSLFRERRFLEVLVRDGHLVALALTRGEASRVGAHWNAVGRYLRTGDRSRLSRFRRTKVQGVALETDPARLADLQRAEDLSPESIYVVRR